MINIKFIYISIFFDVNMFIQIFKGQNIFRIYLFFDCKSGEYDYFVLLYNLRESEWCM
jgi:hypothetical protein